jgi:type II secretory pathway component GspD/PulD (secretin)
MFDVLPTIMERIREVRRAPGTDDDDFLGMGAGGVDREMANVRAFFAEMGVSWPQGSSIKYIPSIGKLVVTNTAENLVRVEEILLTINAVPYQIEIQASYWQVEPAQATSLARKGLVDAAALLDLIRSGSGELLSTSRVITQSGQEATAKCVREYIYPTEFSVVTLGPTNTNTNVQAQLCGAVAEPSSFETREAGIILSVMPEVGPDGKMINLTMTPEVVREPRWEDYGTTYADARGGQQHVPMRQPVFDTITVSTCVAVEDGATILIGGGMGTEEGDTLVYIFVTARLVGLDGKPLRKRGEE